MNNKISAICMIIMLSFAVTNVKGMEAVDTPAAYKPRMQRTIIAKLLRQQFEQIHNSIKTTEHDEHFSELFQEYIYLSKKHVDIQLQALDIFSEDELHTLIIAQMTTLIKTPLATVMKNFAINILSLNEKFDDIIQNGSMSTPQKENQILSLLRSNVSNFVEEFSTQFESLRKQMTLETIKSFIKPLVNHCEQGKILSIAITKTAEQFLQFTQDHPEIIKQIMFKTIMNQSEVMIHANLTSDHSQSGEVEDFMQTQEDLNLEIIEAFGEDTMIEIQQLIQESIEAS